MRWELHHMGKPLPCRKARFWGFFAWRNSPCKDYGAATAQNKEKQETILSMKMGIWEKKIICWRTRKSCSGWKKGQSWGREKKNIMKSLYFLSKQHLHFNMLFLVNINNASMTEHLLLLFRQTAAQKTTGLLSISFTRDLCNEERRDTCY